MNKSGTTTDFRLSNLLGGGQAMNKFFIKFLHTFKKINLNKFEKKKHIIYNPRAFLYSRGASVVIEAPLNKGIGLSRLSFSPNSVHPFMVAVTAGFTNSEPKKIIKQILQKYYSTVTPTSLAEFVGLPKDSALSLIEPWCQVHPWVDQSFSERKKIKSNGKYIRNGYWYGWNRSGPTSEEMIDNEVSRIYEVMRSIQKNGFKADIRKPDGVTRVVILWRSESDWRWFVLHGDHRTAVAAAMGYKMIPIRIEQFVDEQDVEFWPNVINGTYTIEEARQYFDSFFQKLPSCYDLWKKEISGGFK